MRLAGGALGLLAGWGCGGAEVEPKALGQAPLVLRVAESSEPLPASPWQSLDLKRAQRAEGKARLSEGSLELRSNRGRLSFSFPGAAAAAAEPLDVLVRLSDAESMAMHVGLAGAGQPLCTAGLNRTPGPDAAVGAGQSVASPRVYEVALRLEPAEGVDEFWFVWARAPRGARLHGVEVRSLSAAERVPQGDAGWFSAQSEERQALGLHRDQELLIEGSSDGRLRLAHVRPEGCSPGAAIEVLCGGQRLALLRPAMTWGESVLEGPGPWRLRIIGEERDGFALSLAGAQRELSEPRRVLLVTSDTHRGDHVACDPLAVPVRTPALDALAARGTLFEDAWVTTHITNPSHVALLTGTHPRDTGIVDNVTPLAAAAPTLAEAFRGAGFVTWAAVSASHLMPSRSGLGQGFQRFAGPATGEGQGFDAVQRALGWLEEAGQEDLFLWVHVFDAHAPYRPESVDLEWPEGRDPRDPSLPAPPAVPRWAQDVRDLGYLAALYRAEVRELDRSLEPLLVHPAWRPGWIAFTADHGETLGVSTGEFDHRRLDPGNLRVPLILAGPGVPAGQSRGEGVRTLDLGRTLLDLAGLSGSNFPGTSLAQAASEERPRFALARHGQAAAVVQGGRMLVLQLRDPKDCPGVRATQRHQVLLFNVAEDPDCSTDLALRDPEQAGALRKLLVRWLLGARELGWNESGGPSSAAQAAELASLGYSLGRGGFEGFDPDCGCPRCLDW